MDATRMRTSLAMIRADIQEDGRAVSTMYGNLSACVSVIAGIMGAGTTGIAAVLEGRSFVGVELTEHYFRVAERRIHIAQGQAIPRGDQGVLDLNEAAS